MGKHDADDFALALEAEQARMRLDEMKDRRIASLKAELAEARELHASACRLVGQQENRAERAEAELADAKAQIDDYNSSRCPECLAGLSCCGEMTIDGPSLDCRQCQLQYRAERAEATLSAANAKIAGMAAALDRMRRRFQSEMNYRRERGQPGGPMASLQECKDALAGAGLEVVSARFILADDTGELIASSNWTRSGSPCTLVYRKEQP